MTQPEASSHPSSFLFVSGERLWDLVLPEPRWQVEQILLDPSVAIVGGPTGAGKTWFCLDIALSVVTGTPALSRFQSSCTGPAVMVFGEHSLSTARSRLKKLASGRGLTKDDLKSLHMLAEQNVLASEPEREKMLASVRRLRPRLVVLDPLVRMHNADENDANAMRPIFSFLRRMSNELDASVILPHHLRKRRQDDFGTGDRKLELLRGTGDLGAWADAVLVLERLGDDPNSPTKVTVAKQRDAAGRAPFHFELDIKGDAAHLIVHEGTAEDLRTRDLSTRLLEAVIKAGTAGIPKNVAFKTLRGSTDLKRCALEILVASGAVKCELVRREARDGKERDQAVLFTASPTPADQPRPGSAEVPPGPTPTPAPPDRGAGVRGWWGNQNSNRRVDTFDDVIGGLDGLS